MQISGAMKADPIKEAFRTVIVQGHWFPVSEVSDIFIKKNLSFTSMEQQLKGIFLIPSEFEFC